MEGKQQTATDLEWLSHLTVNDVSKIREILLNALANSEAFISSNDILREFKASKYLELGTKELISKFLTIVDYRETPPVRKSFNLNSIQEETLRKIETENGNIELLKARLEGISSILEAFCAVNAYLKKVEIIYVTPNRALCEHSSKKILEFFEQMDVNMKLFPDKQLYDKKCHEEVRLSNGSRICFWPSSCAHMKFRGRRPDYVILDEYSFFNDEHRIIEAASISGGKVISTYTVSERKFEEK